MCDMYMYIIHTSLALPQELEMLNGRKVENEMISFFLNLREMNYTLFTLCLEKCSLGAFGFEVRARAAGRMVATLQFSVLGCIFFQISWHVADSFDGVHARCCLGKNVTFMNNLYPGPLAALIALIFPWFL